MCVSESAGVGFCVWCTGAPGSQPPVSPPFPSPPVLSKGTLTSCLGSLWSGGFPRNNSRALRPGLWSGTTGTLERTWPRPGNRRWGRRGPSGVGGRLLEMSLVILGFLFLCLWVERHLLSNLGISQPPQFERKNSETSLALRDHGLGGH